MYTDGYNDGGAAGQTISQLSVFFVLPQRCWQLFMLRKFQALFGKGLNRSAKCRGIQTLGEQSNVGDPWPDFRSPTAYVWLFRQLSTRMRCSSIELWTAASTGTNHSLIAKPPSSYAPYARPFRLTRRKSETCRLFVLSSVPQQADQRSAPSRCSTSAHASPYYPRTKAIHCSARGCLGVASS